MSKMVAAVRQAVARAVDPVMDWAALRYQKALEKNLRKYGLRYDDLLDPLQDMDTAEALRRLPQEEYDARQQRLKRAMDASLKHTPLDKEVQKQQTPFLPYLQQPLRQVKAEREEKAELGADQPYQRSIPPAAFALGALLWCTWWRWYSQGKRKKKSNPYGKTQASKPGLERSFKCPCAGYAADASSNAPFASRCNAEKSVAVKIERKSKTALCECNVCRESWNTTGVTPLDEPIDIYSKWLDKIEEENARLGDEEGRYPEEAEGHAERANKTRRFDWSETGQMRG